MSCLDVVTCWSKEALSRPRDLSNLNGHTGVSALQGLSSFLVDVGLLLESISAPLVESSHKLDSQLASFQECS